MSASEEPLVPGTDYYVDELGRYVFTAEYHLKRGYCCQSGCRHCPYGFTKADKNMTKDKARKDKKQA